MTACDRSIAVGFLVLGFAGNVWAQNDAFGDPLPPGVLARMGSVRMDCQDSIGSAVFARDGKSLSVSTDANEKGLWFIDGKSGKTLDRWSLPKGARQHAFTPEGRFLVVRTFYQKTQPGVINFAEIHVFDVASKKLVWKTDAKLPFGSMAISADGKLLAGGFDEGGLEQQNKIYLWDLASGKQLKVLDGHPAPVATLAFSNDGKKLLSANDDFVPIGTSKTISGRLLIWSLPSGKLVKEVAQRGFGHAVSSHGKFAACQDSSRQEVHLWDLETDKKTVLSAGRSRSLFAPDGRTLITGGPAQMLRLWDAQSGRELRTFKGIIGNGVVPLAFSPGGKVLATYVGTWWSRDSAIRLWDVDKGIELRPFGGHNADLSCLAFSTNGKKLVSGGADHVVRIWETVSGKELLAHEKHQAPIMAVALAPDGRTVASSDEACAIHLWDPVRGKLLRRLASELDVPKGKRPIVDILSFTPENKGVWVGSRSHTIKDRRLIPVRGVLTLYDTATGKKIRSFKSDDSMPLAVSPNGAFAAWKGRTKPKDKLDEILDTWLEKITVRRLDTGVDLFHLDLAKDYRREEVGQAFFSPDSRLLVLNSTWLAQGFTRDELVPCYHLVELASGRELVNEMSKDHPWTLFLPHGRILAGQHRLMRILAPVTGPFREDRPAIEVVDPVTGKKAGELPSHPCTTQPWAMAANGKFFASGNINHTVLIWDLAQRFKQPEKRNMGKNDLERHWKDLASEDVKKALKAVNELALAPEQSVPFLCQRIKPAKTGNGNVLPSSEQLRAVRAVSLLERAGTRQAIDHLDTLRTGAAGDWLTREAKWSLERCFQKTMDEPK